MPYYQATKLLCFIISFIHQFEMNVIFLPVLLSGEIFEGYIIIYSL